MTQPPKLSTNLRSRCYHKADWNLYWKLLSSVDWTTNLSGDSVDDIWNNFSTIINNIIDKVDPSKPNKQLNAPLWETSQVRQACILRNKAERLYLADKSDQNKHQRNSSSNHLKKTIKSAVQQFEQMLANNSDTIPFWHYVKSKSKTRMCIGPQLNSAGELTDNDQECAEILSDTFLSVFTNEDLKVIPFAPPKTKDKLVDMIFTEQS